jgi:hypothetical protein
LVTGASRISAGSVIAAVGVAAITGCGGGDSAEKLAGVRAAANAAPRAPGRFLTRAELATQLGNGFRRQLYRLAVMSQPGDDAADLDQALPTGTLRDVVCGADGAQPAGAGGWPWSCAVRWETVDGRRRTTRYSVSLTARGCFFAAAHPRLPEQYDATIRTYSEHPLNAVQSLRRGC